MTKEQFERRLEIYNNLKAGKRISSTELRKRYEISKVTARKDMDCLSKCMPITSKPCRGGGYWYTGEPIVLMEANVYTALREVSKDKESEFSTDVLAKIHKIDEQLKQ